MKLLQPFQWTSLLLILIFLTAVSLNSCQKEEDVIEKADVQLLIKHFVDTEDLEFDSIRYNNFAGNMYSVTNLEYYISRIVLISADGTEQEFAGVYYLNAREDGTAAINIRGVDLKEYRGMKFLIGLDSNTNKSGALEQTIENQNMAWPAPMGGGYHFMKLEGHFLDSLGVDVGYAMHLGTNNCVVNVAVDQAFSITNKNESLQLEMNINEWYQNPNVYNFNTAGYIMGNQVLMLKIAENGNNVFTLK